MKYLVTLSSNTFSGNSSDGFSGLVSVLSLVQPMAKNTKKKANKPDSTHINSDLMAISH